LTTNILWNLLKLAEPTTFNSGLKSRGKSIEELQSGGGLAVKRCLKLTEELNFQGPPEGCNSSTKEEPGE